MYRRREPPWGAGLARGGSRWGVAATVRGGVVQVPPPLGEASSRATLWTLRGALSRQEGGASPLTSMEESGGKGDALTRRPGLRRRTRRRPAASSTAALSLGSRTRPRWRTSRRPAARTTAVSLPTSRYCRPDGKGLDRHFLAEGQLCAHEDVGYRRQPRSSWRRRPGPRRPRHWMRRFKMRSWQQPRQSRLLSLLLSIISI